MAGIARLRRSEPSSSLMLMRIFPALLLTSFLVLFCNIGSSEDTVVIPWQTIYGDSSGGIDIQVTHGNFKYGDKGEERMYHFYYHNRYNSAVSGNALIELRSGGEVKVAHHGIALKPGENNKSDGNFEITGTVVLKGFVPDGSSSGSSQKTGNALNGVLTFPGHGAASTFSPVAQPPPNSTVTFPKH